MVFFTSLRICCGNATRLCNSAPSVLLNAKRTFLPRHVRPTLAAISARKKKLKPAPPTPRSTYIEWNYSAELYAFTARLDETVQEDQLRAALTERSHVLQLRREHERLGVPDTEESAADNSSLVDHGAVLITSYTTGWLRAALPRLPEDGVRAVTSYLTSQAHLAETAAGIGMKDIVLSEEYPPSEETMARCLQAFVGALAHSAGEARAHVFVRDFVLARLIATDINDMWEIEDPLGVLAETLQRCGRGMPEPRLLRSAGPGTLLEAFVVGVYSDRRLLSSAPGDSVREATWLAARASLNKLMGLSENAQPLDVQADLAVVTTPAPSLHQWRPFLAEN